MADGKVVIDVVLDDGKVVKGVANIDGKLGGIGKTAGAGALTVGKLAAALGLVALARKGIDMVKNSLTQAFKRIDTMEQFESVMTKLLGSSEKAGAALKRTNEIVKGTAYGLDVAAQSVQNFVTRGVEVDKATKYIEAWGDAVAFYGDGSNEQFANVTDALGKMLTTGKVHMDQLNRLFDAGIPAVDIYAQATGQSAADVQSALSKGEISAEKFVDTVSTVMMEGTNGVTKIAGAAKEGGASWSAVFDNMQTAVARGVANIIQGIDKMLKDNGLPDMRTLIAEFGKKFEEVLNAAADSIPVIAEKIKTVYDVMEPWLPLITGVVGAILTFQTTIAVINTVKNAFMAARLAVLTFNATLLANPFIAIAAAVVGLAIIIYFYWDEISAFLSATWEGIKSVATTVWDGIVDFFKEWGLTILAIITGPIGILVGLIVKYWDEIKAVTAAVWNGIKSFFSSLWAGIKSIVMTAITWYLNYIKSGWNTIKTVTSTVWNAIKSFFSSVWSGIKSVVSTAVNGVRSTVTNIWNSIKSVTSNVWNSIKTTIGNGISKALSTIKGYASKFLNAGKSLLTSLAKGIKQGLTTAVNAVKNGMKKVRSYLPFSPAKEGPLSDLDKSGESFFPTWAGGMKKGERPLIRQVESGMGRVAELLGAIPANGGRSVSVAAAGPSAAPGEPSPIMIQNMHVREEADIQRVADALWRLQQRRDRRRIGR